MYDFSVTSAMIELVAGGISTDDYAILVAFSTTCSNHHIELHQLKHQDMYIIIQRDPDRVVMVLADLSFKDVCAVFFSL